MTSSSSVQVDSVEPDLTETSLNSTKNIDNNLGIGIGISNPAFEDEFSNHHSNSFEGKINRDDKVPEIPLNYHQSVGLNKNLYEMERGQSLNKNEKTSEKQEKKPKIWKKFIGILLTLLSAICVSLIVVIIKLLSHLHPITQTIWRQLGNMCITSIIIIGFKVCPATRHQAIWRGIIDVNPNGDDEGGSTIKVHWNVVGKIICIGLLAGIGMLSHGTALNYLNIADATVITYLSLVFALILSHFILHEKCRVVQSLMAGLIILGAFIITRPPFLTGETEFDTTTMIGLGIKIIDGLMAALFFIGMRYLRALHFAPMILIINLTGFILTISVSCATGLFKFPESLTDSLLVFALGLLTAISHNSILLALKFEGASTVSLIRCADVPFAFIWQITVFHVVPVIWTWIGTLLVCIGVLITSCSKLIGELPKESPIKKRFRFLLK